MAAAAQPNLPPAPPPGFTLDTAPAASAKPPQPPPGFMLDAQAGNTGGVTGSWEPETLGEKVARYATAPSRWFEGAAAADEAGRQRAIQEELARPSPSPLHAAVKSAELGVPAAMARFMAGVTSPASVAEGIGAAVAPEIMGPVIGYQGASTALTPKQPGESPADELERRLLGGAGVAGGAAATVAGAPRVMRTMKAIDAAEESARGKVSRGLARPTLERTLAQTKTDVKFGHEPERAIVGEKINTAKQAEAKLDDLGKQIDSTLNDPKYAGKTINVRDVILRNARGAIADAKRAGNEGAANRIIQIRDAMLKHYGNLNKSPRAAAAMKTTIYGDIKWSGAEHEAEANAFRRSVAGGIRDAVNKAAPEVKELNKRYGDAAAARDELTRSEMLRSNRPMLTRLREGAVAQGARKAAQLIGKKYTDSPFGMTRGPAGPPFGMTRRPMRPPGAGGSPGPASPALPPAGLRPAPTRPTAQLAAGTPPELLPPGVNQGAGAELQSFEGPGEKPLITPPPGTRIPPSGKAIEVGPTTIGPRELAKGNGQPKAPKAAKAEAAPAPEPTLQDKKVKLAELDKKYKDLDQQLRTVKSYERTKAITSKMRPLSDERKALRAEIEKIEPRSVAKPLSKAPL